MLRYLATHVLLPFAAGVPEDSPMAQAIPPAAQADPQEGKVLNPEYVAFEAKFPDLVQRAKAIAATARIGYQREVRLDRKTTLVGTVVEVRYAYLKRVGQSVKAIWSVVLECGSAKTRRQVFLDRV